MGRGRTWTPEQVAEGVAYVCENVERIRATLQRGPEHGPQALGELLAALRDAADPVGPLQAVHHALRRAGDALGILGRTRDASMVTLAGIGAGRPREPVLLCPRASQPCARYAWPEPGVTVVCHVTGVPLRGTTLAH